MSRSERLAGLVALDDASFDAAFGALDIPGRDPAHWALLADAVIADVSAPVDSLERAGARQPEDPWAPLDIEPPARLKPPRVTAPLRWLRPMAVCTGLALAALGLFAIRAPPQGDPLLLVPRGLAGPGEPLAAPLEVAVAVKSASGTARLDANVAYAVGDTLVFQVTLPFPATVELRRAVAGDPDNSALLWTGPLAAGPQTLPVGYAFDAEDAAATFTILAISASGTALPSEARVAVHAPRGAP